MGDGKRDATPGHRRASGTHRGDELITPNREEMRGAAPWERFSAAPVDDDLVRWSSARSADLAQAAAAVDTRGGAQPRQAHDDVERTPKVGSHIDGGVSVAELIAKLGAPVPAHPAHHHSAPESGPDPTPADAAPDIADQVHEPDEQLDTEVIAIPAYSLQLLSELPDLGSANYPHDESDPESPGEQPAAGPAAAVASQVDRKGSPAR